MLEPLRSSEERPGTTPFSDFRLKSHAAQWSGLVWTRTSARRSWISVGVLQTSAERLSTKDRFGLDSTWCSWTRDSTLVATRHDAAGAQKGLQCLALRFSMLAEKERSALSGSGFAQWCLMAHQGACFLEHVGTGHF